MAGVDSLLSAEAAAAHSHLIVSHDRDLRASEIDVTLDMRAPRARIIRHEAVAGHKSHERHALDRHPHDPSQPTHTFYFHVDESKVIDGGVNGNAARWLNHSCAPNCESEIDDDGRVFIRAKRDIEVGEELQYDYRLVIDERYTPKLKAEYPCWCGAKTCRGTLLSPKRGR